MAAKTPQGLRCVSCGQELSKTSFYTSHSNIFIGHDERMPVCKTCLQRQFQIYKDLYGSIEKGIQRTCMAFDIYFDQPVIEGLLSRQDFVFADYIIRLNQRGTIKKNFDDSLKEGFLFLGNVDAKLPEEEEIKIPKRLLDFWGKDYDPGDYEILQKHYDDLVNDNPDRTPQQEIFIRDLCDLYVLKRRARINNDLKAITDLTKTYRETFSQADLSVSRVLNNADSDTLGTMIQKIQNYAPADYYKEKDLYADFSGYEDYWNRNFIRPTKNLIFGTTERDKEFSVPEENEDG